MVRVAACLSAAMTQALMPHFKWYFRYKIRSHCSYITTVCLHSSPFYSLAQISWAALSYFIILAIFLSLKSYNCPLLHKLRLLPTFIFLNLQLLSAILQDISARQY